MTPNEAYRELLSIRKHIEDGYVTHLSYGGKADEQTEKDIETYSVAISALEKQIPKKPIAIRETLLGEIVSDRIISFTCPNCYHEDIGNNEHRFPCCEECGQALDWSVYDG